MHLEPETYRNAVNRIHRLAGSFHGFEKMLLPSHSYDISVQLMAMHGSFKSFNTLMHDAFLMDVNIRLHTPLHLEKITPEQLKLLDTLKVNLHTLSPQQLQEIMYAIRHKKFPFS